MLEAVNLRFSYKKDSEFIDVKNLMINGSGIYGIIGKNGSGKTTLLKLMAGILKPKSGRILFDDKDISRVSPSDYAKQRSYVPQNLNVAFDFNVYEFVLYGRYLKMDIFSNVTKSDREDVEDVLFKMNLLHLKDRMTGSISGGELQRVHLARAIVQGGDVMFLDEPVSNIDITFRNQLIKILNEISAKKTVILVTHDLQFAFNMCKRIIGLKDGGIMIDGKSEDTVESLRDVYDERISYIKHRDKYLFIDEEEL